MKPIITTLILMALAGCYTRPIAVKQHARAVAAFPEIGAGWCAKTYPVKTVTDSSAYHESKIKLDSILLAIKEDSIISIAERNRLVDEVEHMKSIMTQVDHENCDSLYDPLYRLAAKEANRANKLEERNKQLLNAANNIKPIRDTVENTASVDECRIMMNKTILLLEKKTEDYDKWRAIAKKRWWIIAGMSAIMVLGLVIFIRKKIKKKLP